MGAHCISPPNTGKPRPGSPSEKRGVGANRGFVSRSVWLLALDDGNECAHRSRFLRLKILNFLSCFEFRISSGTLNTGTQNYRLSIMLRPFAWAKVSSPDTLYREVSAHHRLRQLAA